MAAKLSHEDAVLIIEQMAPLVETQAKYLDLYYKMLWEKGARPPLPILPTAGARKLSERALCGRIDMRLREHNAARIKAHRDEKREQARRTSEFLASIAKSIELKGEAHA